MNITKLRLVLPLIIIFTILSGGVTAIGALLEQWTIDKNVLLAANLLFFVVSLLVFFMQLKALKNSNPNVFVRSVMGGILIKMAVCVTAVIVYRLVAGTAVSKVSVFAAMVIYLLYLFVEVAMITKLNKQTKNA